jgi:lipopolysaccharide/colanic/teichoic acid biosynthesis glycosyltransferase
MDPQPTTLSELRSVAVNLRPETRRSFSKLKEEIDVPEASTAEGVVSVRHDPTPDVAAVNGVAPAATAASAHATVVRVVGAYDRLFKRCIDLVGAIVCLVILLPVIAGVALAVRLMLGPNIFFCQERVGRNGKTFRMIKFRSMMHDRRSDRPDSTDYNGSDRRHTHKSLNDPRHTPVGRFIRKWSLDELPQLFNVVKGDMSLVGPRPELVRVAQAHNLVDHPRHLVRPGITGLWQVSRERSALLHENVHIDTEYVEHVTFLGDVKIMLRTVGAVLHARGR